MNVRAISSLAANVGVREIKGLNESMFLAIAKSKPMIAVQKYLGHLAKLQNEKCMALMPKEIQKVISGKIDLLK
jgi:hypothetical protein